MSEFTAFRKNLSYVAMIAINEKANMTKVMAVIAMMAVVFAGVAVLASDSTDAADAKITYISGEINADTAFGDGTIVVVNGNLTIVNGATLSILDGSKFTVNEGVTLNINGLNTEGTEKATFSVAAGADVTVKPSDQSVLYIWDVITEQNYQKYGGNDEALRKYLDDYIESQINATFPTFPKSPTAKRKSRTLVPSISTMTTIFRSKILS